MNSSFGKGREGIAQVYVGGGNSDQVGWWTAAENISSQCEQLLGVAHVTERRGGRARMKWDRAHGFGLTVAGTNRIDKDHHASFVDRLGKLRDQLVSRKGDHPAQVPAGHRFRNTRANAVISSKDVSKTENENLPTTGGVDEVFCHHDRLTSSRTDPSGAINWTRIGI